MAFEETWAVTLHLTDYDGKSYQNRENIPQITNIHGKLDHAHQGRSVMLDLCIAVREIAGLNGHAPRKS